MKDKLGLVKELAFRSVDIQVGTFRSYDTKSALALAVYGFLFPGALSLGEKIKGDYSFWWWWLFLLVMSLLVCGVLVCFASFFARERPLLPQVEIGAEDFRNSSLEDLEAGLCNEIYGLLARGKGPLRAKELCLKTAAVMLGMAMVGLLALTLKYSGGGNG